MHKNSRTAGYTLIELMIYVAIVSTLLLAAVGFFGVMVDARVKNQTVSEVDQQGSYAMDYILQTIRNSSDVTLPAAAGTGAQLTLVVPTASLSPTVVSLNGTALQTQEGAGAAVALTGAKVEVSNLQFSNLKRAGTPGVVRVSFTVARTNAANRNQYDYSKTFTGTAALRWP